MKREDGESAFKIKVKTCSMDLPTYSKWYNQSIIVIYVSTIERTSKHTFYVECVMLRVNYYILLLYWIRDTLDEFLGRFSCIYIVIFISLDFEISLLFDIRKIFYFHVNFIARVWNISSFHFLLLAKLFSLNFDPLNFAFLIFKLTF